MHRRTKSEILEQLNNRYNHWLSYPYESHEHGSMWTTVRRAFSDSQGENGIPLTNYHDFKTLRDLERFLKAHNHPYRRGAI